MKKVIIILVIYFCFNLNNIYSLSEKSVFVYNTETKTEILNIDADKKIFPASTTKILTAIIALEHLDINTKVIVSKKAIDLMPYNSSNIGLIPGEEISVEDLLYGLLVKSGNDAALVLEEEINKQNLNTIELMNEKAKELGCNSSNFLNTHGFHNINHYSTAKDMTKILNYAMKNEIFVKITQTNSYTIKPTNKNIYERILLNTNNLTSSTSYEFKIGGKTGYTDEAGNVFIGYTLNENKTLICALYDGIKDINIKNTRFKDFISIIENTYENYTFKTLIEKEKIQVLLIDFKTKNSLLHSNSSDVVRYG